MATLVGLLKAQLALALKLEEGSELSVRIAPRLDGEIVDGLDNSAALDKSAALLVVLSDNFIRSDWCRGKNDAFLKAIEERTTAQSRIFIVEAQKVEVDRPPELEELTGYPFWIDGESGKSETLGNPEPDRAYDKVLADLKYELADELKRLVEFAKKPTLDTNPSVFLALTPGSLRDSRNQIRRYLDQKDINILPPPETKYPDDRRGFEQAVDGHLAQCKLFIQLLDDTTADSPEDDEKSYARLQYDRAIDLEIPVLQWRQEGLNVDAIGDEDYRSLVEGEEVLVSGIEEFWQHIVEKIPGESDGTKLPLDASPVFVHALEQDRPIAEEVCQVLEGKEIKYVLLPSKLEPGEYRKKVEANLLTCEGLIVINGGFAPEWVCLQFNHYVNQAKPRRGKRKLRALAVYGHPLPDENNLDSKLRDTENGPSDLPTMRHLFQNSDAEDKGLQPFLEDFASAAPGETPGDGLVGNENGASGDQPVERSIIFVSYSHQDTVEKNALMVKLNAARLNAKAWSDEKIRPGAEWEKEIEEALDRTKLAILLVTDPFLNSGFIREKEVRYFIKERDKGNLTIYPIIAKDCFWDRYEWLAAMQVRPDERPLWKATELEREREINLGAAKLIEIVREIIAELEAGARATATD